MLDEAKPDIVWAFVENNRHLEILKECAPRHINVIYEKPLASTYKDALAMADLAKKHGAEDGFGLLVLAARGGDLRLSEHHVQRIQAIAAGADQRS